MTILQPNIRICPFFSDFLTDKPVDRSIHAYAPTQLSGFLLRGFIFHDIHKKQGRGYSNSGYKIHKIKRENLLAHAHLWRESTQIEYSSQKMAKQVWNILDWKAQL